MGKPHKLYVCDAEDDGDSDEPVAVYWSVTNVEDNEYTIGKSTMHMCCACRFESVQ